jgi:hypothetical protein
MGGCQVIQANRALVSRSLLKPSRNILFDKVWLQESVKLERLLGLLHQNPSLADHIKSIRMDNVSSNLNYPSSLVDLLERLQHAEELHVTFWTWDFFDEQQKARLSKRSCLPFLKELEMMSVGFSTLNDFVCFVNSKRASLEDFNIWGGSRKDSSPSILDGLDRITVGNLSLSLSGLPLREWRRWLSPDAIYFLDLGIDNPDDMPYIVPLAQACCKLEHLVLRPAGAHARESLCLFSLAIC